MYYLLFTPFFLPGNRLTIPKSWFTGTGISAGLGGSSDTNSGDGMRSLSDCITPSGDNFVYHATRQQQQHQRPTPTYANAVKHTCSS